MKLLARLGNYFHVPSGGENCRSCTCDPAEILPFSAGIIEQIGQYRFRGDYPLAGQRCADFPGLLVKVVLFV